MDKCVWDVREKSAKKSRGERYVSESFLHPAKMDIGLCRRLLEVYTEPGTVVLDPMAGIGTTLVEAVMMGRIGVGVELEDRFAALAELNVAHALYGAVMAGKERGWYGEAKVIRGDARRLAQLLSGVAGGPRAALFSPPYPGTNHPMGRCDGTIRQKYAYDCDVSRDAENLANASLDPRTDGLLQGRLGAARAGVGAVDTGQAGAVDHVIFSPPFGEANRGGSPQYLADKSLPGWNANGHFKEGRTLQISQDPSNIDNCKLMRLEDIGDGKAGPGDSGVRHAGGHAGETPSVGAVITSPPYASRLGEGCGWVRDGSWGGGSLKAISAEGYTEDHRAAGGTLNLGNLRMEPAEIAAVLMSPPYGDSKTAGGPASPALAASIGAGLLKHNKHLSDNPAQIDSAILSPPYANRYENRSGTLPNGDSRDTHSYSPDNNPDNIGQTRKRKSYLEEMLKVYQGIYDVLKPGGIMCLVTKDFVRDRKRVTLGEYTRILCERVGFTFKPCTALLCAYPHTHSHVVPLSNLSFWIRLQESKFEKSNPGERSPYPHEEVVLVFAR